ncbi:MarR family transcriptional regulator [Azospirillum sp. ST 5-10]|uniref:MarR family transcriptional regulator n=1 Tax=unclassified Azospirillum TaxID=2630922 RepID=UPI003F4A2B2C
MMVMRDTAPTIHAAAAERQRCGRDAALLLEEFSEANARFERLNKGVVMLLDRAGIGDISPLQLLLIYALSRQPLQPSKITSLLFSNNKTLAYPLKKLQTRGYVDRKPHSADGRARLLQITRKGQAVLLRLGIEPGREGGGGGMPA